VCLRVRVPNAAGAFVQVTSRQGTSRGRADLRAGAGTWAGRRAVAINSRSPRKEASLLFVHTGRWRRDLGFWGAFGPPKEATEFGSQAGTNVAARAAAQGFPVGDGCGWARGGGGGGFGDLPGGPAAEQL